MARAIIILILVSYVVETKQVSDNEKIRIVIRSDEIFLNDIKQSLGRYLFYFESKINDRLFIFVKKTEEPNRIQLSSNELAALQRSNQNKLDLSYNFVNNITQTSPSVFPNILESSSITGHAIACAGLVARPMTVDECVSCGIGVAHESKVADLQIAKVKENSWMFPVIDSAIFSRALAYRRDAIHIFSNSWAAKIPFKKLNFYEEDVLTEGVRE
ncbi:hypothetical protein MAR_014784, partial [Mya arenaria]